MTSSWELPDNTRRIVRIAAPPTARPSATGKQVSRGATLALATILLVCLCGAGAVSWWVYSSRLNARFENHCKALRGARQWRELRLVSQKWIDANPKNMRAIFFAAQSAEKLGEFDEAVELLLSAPRNQKDQAAIALAEAAEIQFSTLNQPVEAVKNFEEALRLDPREAESRQRLIFVYAMTMERQKMVDHIKMAIDLGLETRENYVYLVGSEWLIFSNGPQYNNLWRKSDLENEHFNVARALGVVANGYVTPEADAKMLGEAPPIFKNSGSEFEPDAPKDRKGREAHYDGILRAYLEKYPTNLELLSYFLSRATAAGDLAETARLLARLPPNAEEDARFWRYKASWQAAKARRATTPDERKKQIDDAEQSLLKAIELNPFDPTARHQLAGILRETGMTDRVDRLEAIYNEGAEIRRLVLQAPSAHIDTELFKRIKDYAAICGQSHVADAMAKRLQLAPAADFFPSPNDSP
jgi:tetratricopeptide (TPR) repeat protein